MTELKKNILSLTLGELKQEMPDMDEKPFRAVQIFTAVHSKNVESIDDIKGISSSLKEKLKSRFVLNSLKTVHVSDSSEFSTKKFLFELCPAGAAKGRNVPPGNDSKEEKFLIEAVLISENNRNTICVSTQVGCNVGCEFCATAKMGFRKNLSTDEIISQVYEIRKHTGIIPTNIVYMGMGEPFLNYDNMMRSLKILTHEQGLNITSGKITVSTVGFKDRIRKFTEEITLPENKKIKNVKLALSLHSTDSGIRESIIPSSKRNRLPQVFPELSYFYQKTRNKITYEYIYFEGLNDTDNDVKRLEKLLKMVPSNINIIPFHPIHFELNKPLDIFNQKMERGKTFSAKGLSGFIEKLRKKGVIVNLRSSSGVDIDAACGQLAVIKKKELAVPGNQSIYT